MTLRVVDLFAGAGGFSTGAVLAGAEVVWAANHWPLAVQVHAANHPATAHACQDLQQANWLDVPAHDLLLASPACQGHSRARGTDRPHHDAARSTAWAVVGCAETHRPPAVLVENVPEFREWVLFPAWKAAMQALGYAIAEHVVNAADHGVPQERVRLFLLCTQSKAPLSLPLPRRQHRAVGDIIDWQAPRWTPIHKPGRSKNTLARITRGRAAHGDRFVAPYYGSGSGLTGRSLDRPLGTVTTRDRWAVVDGDRMRMFSVPEYREAMGFPSDYRLPDTSRQAAIFLLGNAVCPPVARDVVAGIAEAA